MPKDRPNEEEGKGKSKFKIIDRRRIDPDEIEASDAPPEPEPEPIKEEPKKEEPPDEKTSHAESPEPEKSEKQDADAEPDPLNYQNILISFLQTLVTVVWVHLGLVAHPQTQLVTKKLEEARKAIDLYEVLLLQSADHLPANVKVELDRLLQDMKANYVDQLG